MSVRVDSELRKSRARLSPRQHAPRLKPQPLIFEPQHKNIATLIAFLVTIFLGLGAGWLAGNLLSGAPKPTPVNQAHAVAQTDSSASLNSVAEAEKIKQPVTSIEQQGDKDEPKTRARRRAGSRRAYVTARAGEPIPLAVIKGKPIKKAFRHIKKVKIW